MKKIFLLLVVAFLSLAVQAQKVRKFKGFADDKKCELTFTTKVKKGKPGMEDNISYIGKLTIGTKQIPIKGYYEGNVMKWQEKVGGVWTDTMTFDLTNGYDEQYEVICERLINENSTIIKLNEVKIRK
jgi:hypothetical protein